MQSFPSTFSKNKLADNQFKKIIGTSLSSTLANVGKALLNKIASKPGEGVTLDKIASGLDFNTDRNYSANTNVNIYNISSKFVLTTLISNNKNLQYQEYSDRLNNHDGNRSIYENAFKIPSEVLGTMNKYNYIFKTPGVPFVETIPQTKDTNASDPVQGSMIYSKAMITPSLFNPWFGIPAHGFGTSKDSNKGVFPLNIPIFIDGMPVNYSGNNNSFKDNVDQNNINNYTGDGADEYIKLLSNDNAEDVSDCTIKKLVELSNDETRPLGRSTYKYADFMYCKDLGKISNNHLITLRKFPAPIGDNIVDVFTDGTKGDPGSTVLPDYGRLITWFGTDENKLEDICKYHYEATWKTLTSELYDINSKETNADNKTLNAIANVMNPNYREHYQKGMIPNRNMFLNYFFGDSESSNAGDPDFYFRDPHKVYEPKDTTREYNIYEGHLKFNQEINLTFSYKLRYYNGINPKSAFLDLLGNILEVTYKRGHYWGGAPRWLGPTQNTAAWKDINNIVDKLSGDAANYLNEIFGVSSWEEFVSVHGSMLTTSGAFTSNLTEVIRAGAESAINAIQTGKVFDKKTISFLTANIKNKLGRPAIYAIRTVYSGAPTGLWHLTVGNPRNPIMSIGNLILTGADIQHSGPLGLDDFPTDIKVTVSLKHAKARDLVEISQMYTKGSMGIFVPLANGKLEKYFGPSDYKFFANGLYNKDPIKSNDLKSLL